MYNQVGDLLGRGSRAIVGRSFTHKYDFEPIYVFLKEAQITRIVISGRGDVDAQPHRIDIFVQQESRLG